MNRLIHIVVLPICLLSAISSGEDEFTLQRERMVREQIQARGISDRVILQAFLKVQRHLFVLPTYRQWAYADEPLPIEEDQTISQPYIVAFMTQALAPSPGKKILEIGTGSGYQAAILAELVGEVYTIEIKGLLAEKSRLLLESLGYTNIQVKHGDGYLGWKEHAPYDGIIVTCSPDSIPPPLLDQLALGGRMIIPVGSSIWGQDLVLIEKTLKGKITKKKLLPVRFVPLLRDTTPGDNRVRK